jgi:hypothetical protein
MLVRNALLLVAVAAAWTVQASDTPTIPLCGRISGFAGDVNNKLNILVDHPVNIDQAIVIAARPVPFDPAAKSPFADNVDINATFQSKGQTFYAISDRFGVAYIADKDFTGEIRVTVRNRQTDDSSPFELFSYLMNMRECSVEFSPSKPFIGPIPTHLPPQDLKVASFYLVAHPPRGVEGFVLTLSGSSATVFYSPSQTEHGVPLVSGKACPWSGGDIFFTLVPKDDVATTEMTRVTISYQMSSTPTPIQPPPQPNQPPGNQAPNPPPGQPSQPLAPGPADATAPTDAPHIYSPITNAAAASSWSGFGLFCVAVFAYFSIRTIYNYRVEGITKFPEYVPHHEALASVGSCIGAFATHAKNKGRQVAYSRSGYNAVNRQDIYDTNE